MKWKRHSQDRLGRLAAAIEAIAGRDQTLIEESNRVDRLREEGAAAIYNLCRQWTS